MKRVLLHTAFWLMYLVQDILLTSLVNTTRIQMTTDHNLRLSAAHVLVLLIPKMLFTYFILAVALNKLITEGFGKKWSIYSVVVLLLSIILYRILLSGFVYPVIYNWHDNTTSFFYALGFPVALMDIGFVSGAAIAFKQVRQQLARVKTEQSLIQEKLATELKYLRNQTNPHFLFNTLNNIYALSRKKSDEAPDAIMKLSKLLRFMLYDTAKPFITIGDEIRILEDYVDLEKMRYNARLTFSFTKDVFDERELVAPLLLLPFIENAFKHGASESRYASFIQIDLAVRDGILKFSVKNSKENNQPAADETTIGLNNVKRQLELLYTDHTLQVINDAAMFTILLTINLKSHAKHHVPNR